MLFSSILPSYNLLQRGLGANRDDLHVDVTVPLKDAEDDRFALCATASFPLMRRVPKNDSSTSTSPEKGD